MTSPNLTEGTQRFLVRASTNASTARGITYSASSLRRLFFSIRIDPDATNPAISCQNLKWCKTVECAGCTDCTVTQHAVCMQLSGTVAVCCRFLTAASSYISELDQGL